MSASILKELAMSGKVSAKNDEAWQDLKFQHLYPELYELLTLTKFNGEPRQPAKLSIFTNRGSMKVSIHLPSEGRVGYVPIPDFGDLFGAVETALKTRGIDWQTDKNGRKSG